MKISAFFQDLFTVLLSIKNICELSLLGDSSRFYMISSNSIKRHQHHLLEDSVLLLLRKKMSGGNSNGGGGDDSIVWFSRCY